MSALTTSRSLLCLVLAAATPALAQEGLPPADTGTPAPAADAAPPAEPAAPEAPPAAIPPAEEAALPAAAPAAQGGGSIDILSDIPGAEVFVDGSFVGRTPVRVDAVPPGPHKVQVNREGGAPIMREVLVTAGATSRVEAITGSNPNRPAGSSMGEAAPAPASEPRSRLPGGEFFGSFLEQPWAWAAAGIAFVCLVGAALLWSTDLGAIPVVGESIRNAAPDPRVVQAIKFGAFGVAIVAILVALGLFVWPSLPFARKFPLPTISSLMGKKKDPAPAAPAAAPAPASTDQPAQ